MENYNEKSEIIHRVEQEKSAFIKWIKAHKKELILAGISITALIGIIVGIKHKDSIRELWTALQRNLSKASPDKNIIRVAGNSVIVVETASTTDMFSLPLNTENRAIFDVTGHVRNLCDGWNASPEKIVVAAELGIDLLPGQTWVDSYTKGIKAA